MRNDDTGKYLFNLMIQIVRTFPLALYYPLRTLYLKLKNDEQTEKLKNQLLAQQKFQQQQQTGSASSSDVEMKDVSSGGGNKPATAISGQQQQQQQQSADSLIRVTTLMHRQREMHPTLFNTLEGLIDQLLTLKVHWCEELLRNFKQTLYQAYAYAFDSLGKKVMHNIKANIINYLMYRFALLDRTRHDRPVLNYVVQKDPQVLL